MKRRAILLIAVWGLGSTTCTTPEKAETAQREVRIPAPYDLGGPCNEGSRGRIALPGMKEQELYAQKNWGALIEAAKQDVRNVCANAYYWQRLFKYLAEAGHHRDAVQIAHEMKTRGFPLPHSILEKAGSAFLAAEEFRGSSIGVEYAARDSEIQALMRRAEMKLASMAKEELPPNPFVSKGACPFECCTYRQWKTKAVVPLLESIRSSRVIGEIPSDTSVMALTGEVHIEPAPYAVLEDIGILKAGDVIFFLENRGEGYVNYWYAGKQEPELGIDDGLHFFTYEACTAAGGKGSCSLKSMRPGEKLLNEWWVKVRMSGGKEGWVLNTGQFDNTDACA